MSAYIPKHCVCHSYISHILYVSATVSVQNHPFQSFHPFSNTHFFFVLCIHKYVKVAIVFSPTTFSFTGIRFMNSRPETVTGTMYDWHQNAII